MRSAARGAALWMVLLAAALVAAGPHQAPRPASASHERFAQALAQRLELRYAAADSMLRSLLSRDPGYLPALYELVRHHEPTYQTLAFLDSVSSSLRDAELSGCYREVLADQRGDAFTPTRRTSGAARSCWVYLHLGHTFPIRGAAGALGSLYREDPSPGLLRGWLEALADAGLYDSMAAVARAHIGAQWHPAFRVEAYEALSIAEHERGEDELAVRAEHAARADPAWKLPGFRESWLASLSTHNVMRVLDRRPDTALRRHAAAVAERTTQERLTQASAGDLQARWMVLADEGTRRLDRGALHDAALLLGSAAAAADTLADPSLVAYTRIRLGRALVKLGHSAEAEQALLAARDVAARTRRAVLRAEAEHNLLHLYEATGRDAEAHVAGLRFVSLMEAGGRPAIRMMANRDYAMYLRSRGAHRESKSYFERMQALIDSLQMEWYFAGEYHELIGNLEFAQRYYALAQQRGELRAMQGLVRVSMAMGDTGAARRWARIHDAVSGGSRAPESAPLLPTVIAATGDVAAARAAANRAREAARARGQVAAWAALTTDLAAFEADRGSVAQAGVLADSAIPAAVSVALNEVALRARALSAYGLARGNAPDRGRRALRELERDARNAPALLRAEIARLLAAAHAHAGRWTDALRWYGRAADPLDSLAARISVDPVQARFRSAQRRVYDEALALIVSRSTEASAIVAYESWSIRRKTRAYAVPLDQRRELPRLRPAAGTAVVDFVVLDTVAAAVVRTAAGTLIVRLPASPREIRAEVTRLHQALDARVGSSIDASRARFPLGIAHRLHQQLLAPLDPHLAGVGRLIVVPDGPLAMVPFDALVVDPPPGSGAERDARFLMDRFAIASAATMALRTDSWRLPARPALAVTSRSAPAAGRELAALRAVLGGRGLRMTEEPSPDGLAALAVGAGVLHFAVHARASDVDPTASYLDLGRGAGEGALDAAGIARLPLAGQLVVLSACETARGAVLDGEGVMSLGRNFLRAGASATITTLWPVGAAAVDFATAFYMEASHLELPEAMRAARRRMRENGAPAYAWAPFQLTAGPPR